MGSTNDRRHTADSCGPQRAARAGLLDHTPKNGSGPVRLLPRVLARLHTVEKPQHTWLTSPVRWIQRIEGGNAAGGTTACFPLSSSSPTGREEGLSHTVREVARI